MRETPPVFGHSLHNHVPNGSQSDAYAYGHAAVGVRDRESFRARHTARFHEITRQGLEILHSI
jgi:hypothetical protein